MPYISENNISTLSAQESYYLEGFLSAGDRTGFYLAYYSMVGSDDTVASPSSVGKHEASLQAKIASFSGYVGAAAYLSNRLLEEVHSSLDYKGIYAISQDVALHALGGINDSLEGNGEGILSDASLFATASQAWQDNGNPVLFPGRLLNGIFTENGVIANTSTVFIDLISFLDDYYLLHSALPSRVDLLAWVGADGMRAAAVTAAYVSLNDVAGKQVSSFATEIGYSTITTADGNQQFVVDPNGHVVAAELVGLGGSGASEYELVASGGAWAEAALEAASLSFSVIAAAGISTISTLFSTVINPLFSPYTSSLDWTSLTYPVGEGELGEEVPNETPNTPFSLSGSAEGETLLGTNAPLGVGGADEIHAGTGNDAVFGGGGDDELDGGDGDDVIWGHEEEDVLTGGDGDDVLRGGEDDDIIKPGTGGNLVDGGDPLLGLDEGGIDTVDYSDLPSGQRLYIDLGLFQDTEDNFQQTFTVGRYDSGEYSEYPSVDTLISIERIIGASSNDTIYLGYGAWENLDKIDYIDLADSNTGLDEGSRPIDGLDATDFDHAIEVDLSNPTDQWLLSDLKILSLRNVEGVFGTAFNDEITGIASNPTGTGSHLRGGAGDDILTGGSAFDVIEGGEGSDVISGGAGSDDLIAAAIEDSGPYDYYPAYDTVYGNAGVDRLKGTGTLIGGEGNDVIQVDYINYAGFARLEITTGDGNDVVVPDEYADDFYPGQNYNGDVYIKDGVGQIRFNGFSTDEISVVWDVNPVAYHSDPDGAFYNETGDLAIVTSSGESILFRDVEGNFKSWGTTPLGPDNFGILDITLPFLIFDDGYFEFGEEPNIDFSFGSVSGYDGAESEWDNANGGGSFMRAMVAAELTTPAPQELALGAGAPDYEFTAADKPADVGTPHVAGEGSRRMGVGSGVGNLWFQEEHRAKRRQLALINGDMASFGAPSAEGLGSRVHQNERSWDFTLAAA